MHVLYVLALASAGDNQVHHSLRVPTPEQAARVCMNQMDWQRRWIRARMYTPWPAAQAHLIDQF
jgi:hypothetical protein